jgi:hypothetical protein
MDLVSGKTRSTFTVHAVTIANTGPERAITPGITFGHPLQKFAGTIDVQVTDATTGEPVPGATILPSILVEGINGAGDPQVTDEAGRATLRYPKERTTRLSLHIQKDG